jgi:alkyl hydroperoxide reductase subunit D
MENLFTQSGSRIAKDLKLNLKKLLEDSSLSQQEAYATLAGLAQSLHSPELKEIAQAGLETTDLNDEQKQEAFEAGALMGMMNMYYRFRHFVTEAHGELPSAYRMAGLRMNALAQPLLGRETFEMVAFSVSVLNGCSQCIVSHERTLKEHNISEEKIHDLARLAAVSKAISDFHA